jgi:hypothetical protein
MFSTPIINTRVFKPYKTVVLDESLNWTILPNKRGSNLKTNWNQAPQALAHVKVKILLSWPTNPCFKTRIFKCVSFKFYQFRELRLSVGNLRSILTMTCRGFIVSIQEQICCDIQVLPFWFLYITYLPISSAILYVSHRHVEEDFMEQSPNVYVPSLARNQHSLLHMVGLIIWTCDIPCFL